jgi:1-acyl-sn-glycerol-3-phosphate acyltransferase
MTHAWLPLAPCNDNCVHRDPVGPLGRVARILLFCWRSLLVLIVLPVMPLTAIPHPRQDRVIRLYSRLVLRCIGVRLHKSGGPFRNVNGVLVASPHISWVDVLVIWAFMPGTFVAKTEMLSWPGLGWMARALKVIPIDRTKLRPLPDVVGQVTARLRSGQTVVVFPEGTSWCGRAYGPFRPAMFQAAIDAGRPVQPLRLSYHQPDGRLSTVPAFVGDDTMAESFWRVLSTRRTVGHVSVGELQLPDADRRQLARRCQAEIWGTIGPQTERELVT